MMNELEAVQMVCDAAAEKLPERKVFSDLTKGNDGVKGLTLEAFGKKYKQLMASPLLRKLEIRQVREGLFKNKLAEAIMLVDPPEEDAAEIASLLAQARENPRKLPQLFKLVASYEIDASIEDEARTLYPLVFKGEPTDG